VSGSVPYFKQLDGLRALCILFTVVNHVEGHPWYLNGSVGVDVFFALSGFLITNLLLADADSQGRPCLKCFYVRRLFRIVPLYYLVFALYVGAAYTLHAIGQGGDVFPQMQRAWPSVLAFMSEYRPPEAGTFFGHAWTLGIEEKYYLLWPLLFLGLLGLRRRLQIMLLAASLCAEIVLLPTLEMRGYGGLTIGSLVAIVAHDPSSFTKKALGSPAVYVVAMLAAYAVVLATGGGRANILLSVTSALMIASVVRQQGMVSRILSWQPLAAVGKLTYGIYLIHVLIANAVAAALRALHVETSWVLALVLTYGLSVAAAAALKIVVEDPMIAVGRRLSARFMTRMQRSSSPLELTAAANRSIA
jgi:peptidoglycan/LPS O-acetylase OafA/YrhL